MVFLHMETEARGEWGVGGRGWGPGVAINYKCVSYTDAPAHTGPKHSDNFIQTMTEW